MHYSITDRDEDLSLESELLSVVLRAQSIVKKSIYWLNDTFMQYKIACIYLFTEIFINGRKKHRMQNLT